MSDTTLAPAAELAHLPREIQALCATVPRSVWPRLLEINERLQARKLRAVCAAQAELKAQRRREGKPEPTEAELAAVECSKEKRAIIQRAFSDEVVRALEEEDQQKKKPKSKPKPRPKDVNELKRETKQLRMREALEKRRARELEKRTERARALVAKEDLEAHQRRFPADCPERREYMQSTHRRQMDQFQKWFMLGEAGNARRRQQRAVDFAQLLMYHSRYLHDMYVAEFKLGALRRFPGPNGERRWPPNTPFVLHFSVLSESTWEHMAEWQPTWDGPARDMVAFTQVDLTQLRARMQANPAYWDARPAMRRSLAALEDMSAKLFGFDPEVQATFLVAATIQNDPWRPRDESMDATELTNVIARDQCDRLDECAKDGTRKTCPPRCAECTSIVLQSTPYTCADCPGLAFGHSECLAAHGASKHTLTLEQEVERARARAEQLQAKLEAQKVQTKEMLEATWLEFV